MANDCIPYYEPGGRVPCHAASALTGKRFVKISADRQSGPLLNTATDGSNYVVDAPTAAGRVFGVTSHDVAQDGKVTIIRGSGFIVPVTAAGNIAAGAEVEVDGNGKVVTKSSGVAVGVCLSAVTSGNDAQIALYN